MPEYTCEYTHNGRRGLLQNDPPTSDDAMKGFKHTVNHMTGKNKTLHADTFTMHESKTAATEFVNKWTADRGRPAPTQDAVIANAARVFPKSPADKPAVVNDDDE